LPDPSCPAQTCRAEVSLQFQSSDFFENPIQPIFFSIHFQVAPDNDRISDMSRIYFCRDGILRREFMRYEQKTRTRHVHLVPFLVYEQVVDKHAFLKSLHSCIAFEHGLTVGELMENLSPWAETMIGAGVLDFPAFLEEVRRTPTEIVDDVEEIILSYRASLDAVPAFEDAAPDEIFGKPRVSGKVAINQKWDMRAVLTEAGRKTYGGATEVAIDYTPMSEWKHLEIKLDLEGTFIDNTPASHEQQYIGVNQAFTDRSHPMIDASPGQNGNVTQHSFPIRAPSPDFFNCLIRGFFWEVGFSYSPAQRDEQVEIIKSRTEELKEKINPDDALEEALEKLGQIGKDHDEAEDEEFYAKTIWLDQINTACEEKGLPLPRKM
jgi:hypothetical protein